MSKNIFDVSGGADLITNFNVELPPQWRNTECIADLTVSEGQLGQEVDIEVSGSHPLTGDRPRAHQFGGCGVRGSRVTIPFPVLTHNVDIDSDILTQTLVEVKRWRYGVFSETGAEGDRMYPLVTVTGESQTVNLGCTDEQMRLGAGLCPLMSYNDVAATKQNLLCARQSARRSILNQFTTKDGAKFVKAEMRYVMPLDTKRVVLVLDQSSAMVSNWKSVLASTFQFINSLREGTELAIVSFTDNANIHLQPTRVEGGNREGLHYRIPRKLAREDDGEERACLECGLGLAEELATNTTTIVTLVSSYVYFDSKNNSKLMEFEQSANPILHWLVFGSSGSHQHITTHEQQPVFLINDHQGDNHAITSQLSLALATTIADYPSMMFHQEQLPMEDTQGSFSVEASLSSDLWLQVLVEDTTEINVFEIKSPSGQVFSFPKFDAGLVYFSLRGPRETGVWSYTIKLYSRTSDTSNKMVVECWGAGSQSQVQISSWTLSPGTSDQPAVVYAKLEQEGVGVVGATVTAVISTPGQRDVTVTLMDNGLGYPDITLADGIYSGYFTQFAGEPALYSVNIQASNNSTATVINTKKLDNVTINVDGSSFPSEPSIPLEAFKRFTAAPSFYISQGSQFTISSSSVERRDVFPPNRITDFRLANYFNNSLFVTLSWTSPGDDLTRGKAFRYEIRCFTAREALTEENFGEQGILIHDSLVPIPEPAGTEQRCTVGVPWPNEVFYYSIVAFDAAGNRGEVSNSIGVYVEEPITTTIHPASTIKFSNMKDVSSTLPLKSFIQSESLMYIIAGIISLILIIIVIILTVIIRRLGGCVKKHDPSSVAGSDCVPELADSSLPDLCHDNTSYIRNSVSYISGYDLPEMWEYSLDSPQKAGAQEHHYGSSAARVLPATEQSQYLGMNTSSLYSPSIRSPTVPGLHSIDISQYKTRHTTTHKYNTVAGVSRIYSGAEDSPPVPGSPSISPVNSNYTGGQSTDCSVSVSGSDHELISDNLQVVMLPPPHVSHVATETDTTQFSHRPEPKPRKIPPAVPNKTVHASLV